MSAPDLTRIGVVVIGRNESDWLAPSLSSVSAAAPRMVYVDSGSTDDSVAVAGRAGVASHELDPSRPFSAARARNEGFDRLLAAHPDLEAVQFVDGDCTIDRGWLTRAVGLIGEHADTAIVCGRLRERDPSASIYQRLCDVEWDLPPGVIEECGGVFAVRVKAFREVGGFDASRIAGEEPELCSRLRAQGWKIRRTRDEMGLHDASIRHFSTWWRRSVRAGWAEAALAQNPGRHLLPRAHAATRSNLAWGLGLPVALALAAYLGPLALAALVSALLLQWHRIARGFQTRGRSGDDSRLYAAFIILGKLPQAWGALRFASDRLRGRATGLIEPDPPAAP